jgi:serine protease Do
MDKAEGDAFIITNHHIVCDTSSTAKKGISDEINIYLYGSEINTKAIEATYVGGSSYYDIAVLRVENSEILKESSACEVDVADSDKIAVGTGAIAIGNARGQGISSTSGVVSVDSEYITMTDEKGETEISCRVIRVDTALNLGNSGGGIFDDKGNLIGIVIAKTVYNGVENIGYAIPSNVAVSIAENIIYYCYGTDEESVKRALLGITVSISDSKAVYNSETGLVSIEETVFIYDVGTGSIAQGALMAGDILISATINGNTKEITRQHHIIDMMLDARIGDVVTLNILRGGEEKSVSFTITKDCLAEY